MHEIVPLFSGVRDTAAASCLQGHMGDAWVDRLPDPTAGQIVTGDLCFFAGDGNTSGAAELARHIPPGHRGPVLYMVPPDEDWSARIEEAHPDRHFRFYRYAFRRDTAFDRALLGSFCRRLPAGYRSVPFDAPLYGAAMAESWSRDFCSQFESCEDYLRRGIGQGILCGDELVCGASSYTIYDGGIEIEVGTKEPHRRRGLALACAAGLILRCLDRGLYPNWDAANLQSVALAEKLGYRQEEPYFTYEITRPITGG